MFGALLGSNLRSEQLSVTRLEQEAIGVVGAAVETVSRALTVASYHLLANPPVLERLHQELEAAIPNPAEIPDLDTLQQLPYLTACIHESLHCSLCETSIGLQADHVVALRISIGTTQRSPRIFPRHNIAYKAYSIPAGTAISMDIRDVFLDPILFPSPDIFKPERWLDSPLTPDGRPYSRYMVAFARGPRNCLGMHVAYAEMYIGLATLNRRFAMELCVDVWMDRFVPRPRPGTKGVRVLVK